MPRGPRTAQSLVNMVRDHIQHYQQLPYRDGFDDDDSTYGLAPADMTASTPILRWINKAKDELLETGYFQRTYDFNTQAGFPEYELDGDLLEFTHVTVCGTPLHQVTIAGMDTRYPGWQRYAAGTGGSVPLGPPVLTGGGGGLLTTAPVNALGNDPGDDPGNEAGSGVFTPDVPGGAASATLTTGTGTTGTGGGTTAPTTAGGAPCVCRGALPGRPRRYYTYSDMIGLDPVPDGVYDVTILAERVPPDLALRTDTVLYLPHAFHDALASRAAWWISNMDAENTAAAARMPALDADWKQAYAYCKRVAQERTTSEDDQIMAGEYRRHFGWGAW